MNTAHKHKIPHFVVSKLTNSGAIACVYCLELGDFSTYAQYPDLISTSLSKTLVQLQSIRGTHKLKQRRYCFGNLSS